MSAAVLRDIAVQRLQLRQGFGTENNLVEHQTELFAKLCNAAKRSRTCFADTPRSGLALRAS